MENLSGATLTSKAELKARQSTSYTAELLSIKQPIENHITMCSAQDPPSHGTAE